MKIYKVTTEGDCEGRSIRTLGYCTGDPADIQKYYEDQKTYQIYIDELKILQITPDMVDQKQDLLKRKTEIEKELQSINNFLNNK